MLSNHLEKVGKKGKYHALWTFQAIWRISFQIPNICSENKRNARIKGGTIKTPRLAALLKRNFSARCWQLGEKQPIISYIAVTRVLKLILSLCDK